VSTSAAKPNPLTVEWNNVPAEILKVRRWVGWKYELRPRPRTGELKWTKVPYQAGAPTYKASSTNAKSWGTVAQAKAAYAHGDVDGVGFVLDDGWAGGDFDDCRDPLTGEIDQSVLVEIRALDSYAEVSASGTGAHVLLHGAVPDGGHKQGNVEAYSAGRFFTVTGHHLTGTPATVEGRQDALAAFCSRHFPKKAREQHAGQRESYQPLDLDDKELLARALDANDGGKFRTLWEGAVAPYPSPSEAIAALLCKLAFWTRKDAGRMDRLFQRSGLLSEKWGEKRGAGTWGECEIASAIEFTSDVYDPPREEHGGGGDRHADDRDDDGDGEHDDEEDETVGEKKRPPSIAVQLVELAHGCEFFHDAEREAWVTFPVCGHQETTRVNAGAFWDWLDHKFHTSTGRTANAAAKQEAQGVFRGRAKFDGPQHAVHVRLAEHDGALYLDLADEARRAVKITARGWELAQGAPVKLWRPKGILPLPVPVTGGKITELRQFVNIADEEWPLYVGFLLGCYRAAAVGGHPVLAVGGEQGSAKSTLARITKLLVDPNRAPLRAEPSDKRDLAITAQNNRLLAYDNLSGNMQHWLSDSLCRVSTGGGHATRQLYTDAEEMIFDSTRPIVLTSIADVASKSDLVDRCIFLSLPRISEEDRREEGTFWPTFEQRCPGMLGALLNAVSAALRRLPTIAEKNLPRMADFAKWVIAAETALPWEPGIFLDAYRKNRAAANTLALDASLVGQAMLDLVPAGSEWKGTSKELLAALNAKEPQHEKKPGWPATARAMSDAIRLIAPNLRAVGFTVPDDPKKANRGNVWQFTRATLEKEESPPPPPPQGAREPKQSGPAPVDIAVDEEVEVEVSTAMSTPISTAASPGNIWESGDSGGGGDADPSLSNGYHPELHPWKPLYDELVAHGMDTQEALVKAKNESQRGETV